MKPPWQIPSRPSHHELGLLKPMTSLKEQREKLQGNSNKGMSIDKYLKKEQQKIKNHTSE